MLVRNRILSLQLASLINPSSSLLPFPKPTLSFPTRYLSHWTLHNPTHRHVSASASKTTQTRQISDAARFVRTVLFVPPGVDPDEVTEDMVLPGSNIVIGPYAGESRIKEVEFVKSSGKAKECPKDHRPEFAILGRSNVGKSSLINALVRKKEVALTSKKPGFFNFSNFLWFSWTFWVSGCCLFGFKTLKFVQERLSLLTISW